MKIFILSFISALLITSILIISAELICDGELKRIPNTKRIYCEKI